MLAIKNGKIITVTQGTLERGTVLVENGKITAVGTDIAIPESYEVIDAEGKWVTPGFVDSHSHVSVETMPHARGESVDLNETTSPNTGYIRALDALNPKDAGIIRGRQGGITTSLTIPGSANVCCGTGIAFKHKDGATVFDIMIEGTEQMKFALGENPKGTYGGRNVMPKTRMGTGAVLREILFNAKVYSDALLEWEKDPSKSKPKADFKLEALVPVVRGEMKCRIHAHRSDDIVTAIRVAEEYNLDYALEHVTEGHLIKDFLKEKDVFLTLGPLFSSPSKSELFNQIPENAAILSKMGLKICLTMDGSGQVGMLALNVGRAIAYGLDEQTAFEGVTINPATLLGLQDRIGSIEVGKDADMAIFSGHPFCSMSRCEKTIIDGEVYDNLAK